MGSHIWTMLAIGVLTVVVLITSGQILALILLLALIFVYVRHTPHKRFERATAARINFLAQLNPVKQKLSSLSEARESGNASRFYDIHQDLVSNLPKFKENAISSWNQVQEYSEWHKNRYGELAHINKTELSNDPVNSNKDTNVDFASKLNEFMDQFSYTKIVDPIEPIPSDDVSFFNKAASECHRLFDESLVDQKFALVYEQKQTRRSIENMRVEIAAANNQATKATAEAKKATRKAKSAERKARQANQNNG